MPPEALSNGLIYRGASPIYFTIDFALAATVVLVAGIFRGMPGFGARLIVVPCLITILGPLAAVVVASLIERRPLSFCKAH